MKRSLYFAAVLLISAAASRADDIGAPPVAKPDPSSAAPADANAPSQAPAPAPATKTDSKPAADSASKSPDNSAQPRSAAPEAPAPAPTAPAPKAAPKPEAKLEDKSAQAPVVPAPEKAPMAEAKPVEKPLNTCAAKLEPVVDSYQQAHDSLLAWLRTASEKMDAADAKIAGLKKNIAENEAKITQLKLDSAQKNETQARDLDKSTRDLWSQLKTEDAHRKDLCRALSSVAGQKVRDLNRSVLEQFEKSSQTP